ncbi:hypothetical protein WA026_005569 [Henosepilachna vigintioctopunctata]|uniref:Serpin domain-containing protein n=1 Tax=Henosepilachna vigintioctopunctata TaxID=420089 RepID=A0AAW1TVF1_9CUCU
MLAKKYCVVLFLGVVLASGDDTLKEFRQGTVDFSSSLYREIVKHENGNVIASPLSVQIGLALIQLGASGETALELAKGLHLPNSPEKIKESFKDLLTKLRGNEFYTLNSANKVFVKDGYTLNPDYFKLSEEIFDAGLENIDFTDTVQASQTINKWVEGKTNDKIKNLISPDMLNALTRLVLVNAVYFKANWSMPFDVYATTKRKFFKSEEENTDVTMMHQVETFNFAENKELDAKFLELPYDGGDVSFTIVLPNKKVGLNYLEKQLNEVLKPQNYSYERINLFLPKFKIESSLQLVPTLKALGIKKPFDGDESDLSGILENKERLVISDVIQKAFINVTETGTEAAAATAEMIAIPLSASAYYPTPPVIEVNRPFFFFLTHVRSGHILFLGRVTDVIE